MEVSTIADTLATMARQGGGTLDLSTGAAATRERGYYVGGARGIAPHLLGADMGNLNAALADAFERFRSGMDGSGYVGVWQHKGTVYVDATDWHATEWDALEAGRGRGEIAVWDIAKECEIPC